MRRVACPANCDHGKFYFWGNEKCYECAGIGRDMKSDLWAEPCRICNGRGSVPKNPKICTTCGGRGFILVN